MNKTKIRLSRSGIEYLTHSWGIFSGCENWANGICPVPNCWAKSIAYRFPNHYPDGFNPHYYPEAIDSPKHIKKPGIIGIGWVGDVIGYGLAYKKRIYSTIEECPQHTFLFLTKNADRLINWSPFPDNCWVGVTATDFKSFTEGINKLSEIEANVKYISFEPLLDRILSIHDSGYNLGFLTHDLKRFINWVIIGAQTKPTIYPNPRWVHEIIVACREAGIPYFLKDNLAGCLTKEPPYYHPITHKLRQELPE